MDGEEVSGGDKGGMVIDTRRKDRANILIYNTGHR
jgi:hypothetical protein